MVPADRNRSSGFAEEQAPLRPLFNERLDADDGMTGIRVSTSSTIQGRNNTYSVPSRLIAQPIDLRISAEVIELTHLRKLQHGPIESDAAEGH